MLHTIALVKLYGVGCSKFKVNFHIVLAYAFPAYQVVSLGVALLSVACLCYSGHLDISVTFDAMYP